MITIVTCTGRQDPKFEFLADSIYNNACSIDPSKEFKWLQWVIVDMRLWYDENRREYLADKVKGRVPYLHVAPKPQTWQGPTRLTQSDFYALCSARNTGLCYAKFNYVVLFDDCILADDLWLEWHLQAARNNIALAGSYESVKNAVVENGKLMSCDRLPEDMKDHRVKVMGEDVPPQKAYGAWMYGLNMGFPLRGALLINGFDEMYDGQGGSEDTDFGVRLERIGVPIYFSSLCKIFQVLDTHDAVCGDPGFAKLTGQKVTRKQKELVLRRDNIPHFANEFLIEKLLIDDKERTWTLGDFDLQYERRRIMQGKEFIIPLTPTEDWRDSQKLSDMI